MIFGLMGELVGIVVDAVVELWKEIVKWFFDLFARLKRVWNDVVFKVKKVLAEALIKFIEKYYYQRKDGRWMEQTTTREIPEEEVPPHIRNRAGRRETDVTQEVHEEMELAYG